MIQIHDMCLQQHTLAVDLRDIIGILGDRALGSSWQVAEQVYSHEPIEIIGKEAADRLAELSNSGQRIKGNILRDFAGRVTQVIWGEFQAFDGSALEPWLIVRAIDSSWYEVETGDQQVLENVRRAFRDVREGGRRSILTFHQLP